MKRFIWRFSGIGVPSLLFGLILISCAESERGYVHVRLINMINLETPIYVSTTPISGLGERIFREGIGTIALTNGASWGNGKTYCELQVRKNRITVVTVRVVNQQPRCECEIRAPESTAARIVCK